MIPWIKSPNLYAMAALVILGGVIVAGIFQAGVKHERNEVNARTMEVNTKIVEARAEDRAALAAEAAEAVKTDAEVRAGITQACVLTEETAKLLALVK
jgi:hypothetical protein